MAALPVANKGRSLGIQLLLLNGRRLQYSGQSIEKRLGVNEIVELAGGIVAPVADLSLGVNSQNEVPEELRCEDRVLRVYHPSIADLV